MKLTSPLKWDFWINMTVSSSWLAQEVRTVLENDTQKEEAAQRIVKLKYNTQNPMLYSNIMANTKVYFSTLKV